MNIYGCDYWPGVSSGLVAAAISLCAKKIPPVRHWFLPGWGCSENYEWVMRTNYDLREIT